MSASKRYGPSLIAEGGVTVRCVLAVLSESEPTRFQPARMALYGLSIGSFLHVGATDLLPQVGESHRRYVPYLFLVGIALYAISEWLLARQF